MKKWKPVPVNPVFLYLIMNLTANFKLLSLSLMLANGLSVDTDKLDWWKRHEVELPLWSKAFKACLLLQPSSAAAERVFSLLQNSFTHRQTLSLEDYIQTSVMLQYNYRDMQQ